MGCCHTFTCTECSLSWEVGGSGGIDYGMTSAYITLSCANCMRVSDARVRMSPSQMGKVTRATLDRLPVCAVCGSDQVCVWQDGEPCPRCSGGVLRDQNSMLLRD